MTKRNQDGQEKTSSSSSSNQGNISGNKRAISQQDNLPESKRKKEPDYGYNQTIYNIESFQELITQDKNYSYDEFLKIFNSAITLIDETPDIVVKMLMERCYKQKNEIDLQRINPDFVNIKDRWANIDEILVNNDMEQLKNLFKEDYEKFFNYFALNVGVEAISNMLNNEEEKYKYRDYLLGFFVSDARLTSNHISNLFSYFCLVISSKENEDIKEEISSFWPSAGDLNCLPGDAERLEGFYRKAQLPQKLHFIFSSLFDSKQIEHIQGCSISIIASS